MAEIAMEIAPEIFIVQRRHHETLDRSWWNLYYIFSRL